jgi:hypothetical protein
MSKPVNEDAKRKRRWQVRFTRDGVLFIAGLIGVAHETFWAHTDRISLLAVFVSMMGLPTILRMDERRNGKDK